MTTVARAARALLSVVLAFALVPSAQAQSSCPGNIPAGITTPAALRTAVNIAQSAACPGADWIDLAGATITFADGPYTDMGEALALPTITTALEFRNGTITRSAAAGFRFLAVGDGGTLQLNNLTVSNGGGGGIALGGAVRVEGNGNLTATGTTFLTNSAPGYGGGAIIGMGSGTIAINDSLFQGNSAATTGGAIHAQLDSVVTIQRTRFLGNTASIAGALHLESAAVGLVQDSLFAGNSAGVAVIVVDPSPAALTLINSTIAGNVTAGILFHSSVGNTLRNSLVWGNASGLAGTPGVTTDSAVEGYAGATINTGYTAVDFFVAPLLAPSAANTGANYNAALYDWTLRPFSPAIDAGNGTFASTQDLLQLTRQVNDPDVANTGVGTVDMGAYERQMPSCGLVMFPHTLFGASNAARRLNLRDAVLCANLNGPGADAIDLNGVTVSFDTAYAPGTALPPVTTNITLRNGLLQRDFMVAPEFRLMDVAATGTLTLEAMTLRYGAAGSNPGNAGGAIRNAGGLNVVRSTLADNSAHAGGAIAALAGAQTSVSRSTLSGNTAVTSGAAFDNRATATVSNSTVTGQGFGSAAIDNGATGTLTLINATVAGNGIAGVTSAGSLVLANSILADNTDRDCIRTAGVVSFSAGASNLIETSGANACGTAGTQFLALDPQLGTLTGAPAHRPIASAASPAVNAGDNASLGGATLDQPGNTRVQQGRVDLGSVESAFAAQAVTLQFNAATSNAAEAAGFGNLLRVTTSDGNVTVAAATVAIAVTGGTAAVSDYALTGTITVPAGTANNALVSIASGITVTNDATVESNETLQLTLSAPTGATLGAQTVTSHTIANDDVMTLSIADVAQAEGNVGPSTMIFSVVADRAVQGGFVLDYTTTNLSASAGSDYAATSGSIAFAGTVGETHTIAVTINGDTLVEGNETFRVSFPSAGSTVAPGGLIITDTAIGTITNDDTGALTIANVTQSESGSFIFTVTSSHATAAPFSVDWTLAAGTTNAADYVGGTLPAGGTLTFSGIAGETRTFTVPVLDDALVEPTETFTVGMANFSTAGSFSLDIGDTAAGTITDNDVAALTIADASRAEGNSGTSLMTFTATLDVAVPGGFTVNYATAALTATAGSDYVTATGTLTFAGIPGETQTFTVAINGDTLFEPDETLQVSMNSVSNASVASTDTAIGTIINDDAAGYVVDTSLTAGIAEPDTATSFTIRLGGAPSGSVILDFASTDPTECTVSPANLTFTPGNWNAAQTITIAAVDDAVADGAQPCAATIARSGGTATEYVGHPNPPNVGVTVADNEVPGITVAPTAIAISESGGTATFALAASTAPTGGVLVPIGSDGQCEIDTGSGFGTIEALTLPAGSTAPRTVTVRAVNDSAIEGAHSCAIMTGDPSSADASYDALAAADVANVTASVADNDVLHTAAAGAGGAEGSGVDPTFSFTVTRSGATTVASSVGYAFGGSGVAGTDYVLPNPATDITGTGVTATATTLSFAANATTATITVTVNGDRIVEPDFTLALTLATPVADGGAGTGTITGSPASLTVSDDDVAGYIVDTTATAASIAEPSASTTFTIALSSQPAGTVILDVASTDSGECTVSPVSFTFTAVNWNIAQTITIAAVDDAVADGSQPCAATLTRNAASTAAEYAAVPDPANVAVVVTDDDQPGVSVAPTAIAATEGGADGSYTVVLDSEPSGPVTIAVTDDAQTSASPSTLQFTAADWNQPQTVTVVAIDDAVVEGAHAGTITHSASGGDYAGVAVADVTVAISDNDAAGIVVTPTSGLVTTEAGGSAGFTVVLSSQPSDDVVLALSSNDSGEGTPSVASLTFTAANWNTPQTVTVTGVDDAVVDGDIAYGVVTAPATSADPDYDGLDPDDVSLTNRDDDGASFAIADVAQVEGDAGDTAFVFSVTLSGEVVGGVSVAYATADDSATAPADYASTSGTLVFDGDDGETRTITVQVAGDTLVEGDERFLVVLSAPTVAAVTLARAGAIGTIVDDDAAALLAATKRVTQVGTVTLPVIYEIVLSNTGAGDQADDPASDELIDVLPSSIALQNATASAGTVVTSGNTVRWNGALAAGASVTLQIRAQVVVTTAGPISNQAQVAYDSDGDGSNDGTALSDDPGTPASADASVFTFAGALPPAPPQMIPALDLRTLLGLALCMGLLGAWMVRRQGP